MLKIEALTLKNIGVFDDLTLQFPSLHPKDKPGTDIYILTGPNGCGKTTVLLALAGVFMPKGVEEDQNFTVRFLRKRVRFFEKNASTYKSSIILSTQNAKHTLVGCQSCKRIHVKNFHNQAESASWSELRPYGADYYPVQDNPLSFAVFAYSGYRFIQHEAINTIQALKNDIRENLDFIKTNQNASQSILQWIANSISKSAIEKARGNEAKAQKFAESVRIVEQVLSEIIQKEVKFGMNTEPTEVLFQVDGEAWDFDVLPDGLRSLISWIADLLMRLDLMLWVDDTPILERRIILLLDEIEVHLHPSWQRRVLPTIKALFKNAQIFVTTHSPFITNSVDDAFIFLMKMAEKGSSQFELMPSNSALSYNANIRTVFGITEQFGVDTQAKLHTLYKLKAELLKGHSEHEPAFEKLADELAEDSEEMSNIIRLERLQLERMLKKQVK